MPKLSPVGEKVVLTSLAVGGIALFSFLIASWACLDKSKTIARENNCSGMPINPLECEAASNFNRVSTTLLFFMGATAAIMGAFLPYVFSPCSPALFTLKDTASTPQEPQKESTKLLMNGSNSV